MKIYIVTEVDEREGQQSFELLSAHIDAEIAVAAVRRFNDALRGRPDEIGHYAIVHPVELDLTGDGPELTQLRDKVIRQQMRMARAGGR